MNKYCNNCNFFCAVRKWSTYEKILTHVCTYFLVTEKEDYIPEVTEYDMCECWTERKDND